LAIKTGVISACIFSTSLWVYTACSTT